MEFSEIKGFGEKRIALLASVGINKPADLISYFPARYVDTKNLTNLANVNEGDRVVILATTTEKPKVSYIKKRLNIVKVKFTYDGKTVWCSWFNQPYMAKNIVEGRYYYITGKVKKNKTTYEISTPELFAFTGNEPPVISVYKPIGKVSSKLIAEAIKSALNRVKIGSLIPDEVSRKLALGDVNEAIRNIHFPSSSEALERAKRTIAIERLGYMLSAFSIIKSKTGNKRTLKYTENVDKLRSALKLLPFTLTPAQVKCIEGVLGKLHSPDKVNCLLEGDVGSGKTIVAFLLMYYATLSGYQTALMCPTEILAQQHYRKATEFFGQLGLSTVLLTGSVTGVRRNKILREIESGNAQVIVGTHACFSDEVNYLNLAFVVTDEQHRFGVAQRAKFESKAESADTMVMSATPIPRTLALTLYGDLDRFVIDAPPLRKAKITTSFVPTEKEENMWKYVSERAKMGEKTFIVAPRISDDEDEGVSAERIFEQRKKQFGDKIALLHGKMKESEKNEIMQEFAFGKTSVLVATTVVEVGIDVPFATTMIIYDADRFGLSQLHQLRGRVGRGEINSYCFVLSSTTSPHATDRIRYFVENSDGFALAEFDFKTRGAGDFLGYSQHGAGAFPSDIELINIAREVKEEILSTPSARNEVEKSLSQNKYDFFGKITLN